MSLIESYDHTNLPIGPDGTPYQFYEDLRDEVARENRPIGWSEQLGGFWVVAGREESREIHRNTAAFSNRQSAFPTYGTSTGTRIMIAEYDPPEHTRYRGLVNDAFSPVNIRRFDGQIREIASSLIDGFIGDGAADLCQRLGNPVPANITAALLGLPAERGDDFRTWTNAMAQLIRTDPELAQSQLADMKAYFEEAVEDKRRNPGQDILTSLVQAEVDGQGLTDQELLDFFEILLIGGLDNTSRMLATVIWRLSWDVELRRRLTRNPELVPLALEEFLRMYAPAKPARMVDEEVTVGGVTMEPGQVVHFCHPVANRDPREFDNPDLFIADRSPNRHLGLGLGIHRCLGLHLVKIEVAAVTQEFLRRLPEFWADPELSPRWECGQVEGFVEFPIRFPAGGGHSSRVAA